MISNDVCFWQIRERVVLFDLISKVTFLGNTLKKCDIFL